MRVRHRGLLLFIIWAAVGCGEIAQAEDRPLGWAGQELWASRRYEYGVSERALLLTVGRWRFAQPVAIEAALEGSFFDHWGPSLVGFSVLGGFVNARSDLVLSFQHERWSSWRVSENRLEFYWLFQPRETFSITFGLGFRSPQFNSLNLGQALTWAGESNEIAIAFRAEGRVLELWRFWVSLLAWNFDRMRLETGDNLKLSAMVEYHLTPAPSPWRLAMLATQGIKGASGGVLSFGQNQISIGLRYEPAVPPVGGTP